MELAVNLEGWEAILDNNLSGGRDLAAFLADDEGAMPTVVGQHAANDNGPLVRPILDDLPRALWEPRFRTVE